MTVQEEYRVDMAKYAEQVRRYNMEDDIRLRGISNIEDTNMQNVHFSYRGEVYNLIMNKDTEDLNNALRLKVQQIKEMYYDEATDDKATA